MTSVRRSGDRADDIRRIVSKHLPEIERVETVEKIIGAIKAEIDVFTTLKALPPEPDAKTINAFLQRTSRIMDDVAAFLREVPDQDSPYAHRLRSAVVRHLGEDEGQRVWKKHWPALDALRPTAGVVSAATKDHPPVARQRLRRLDEKPPKGSLTITDTEHFVAGLLSNVWQALAEQDMPRPQSSPKRGSFAGLVVDLAHLADRSLTEATILNAIRSAVHDARLRAGKRVPANPDPP